MLSAVCLLDTFAAIWSHGNDINDCPWKYLGSIRLLFSHEILLHSVVLQINLNARKVS